MSRCLADKSLTGKQKSNVMVMEAARRYLKQQSPCLLARLKTGLVQVQSNTAPGLMSR